MFCFLCRHRKGSDMSNRLTKCNSHAFMAVSWICSTFCSSSQRNIRLAVIFFKSHSSLWLCSGYFLIYKHITSETFRTFDVHPNFLNKTMSFYFESGEWMDQRIDPGSNFSEVFLGGINTFLQFACNQADYEERQALLCLCARCKNVKQRDAKVFSIHLSFYGVKEIIMFRRVMERNYTMLVRVMGGGIIRRMKRKCGRILVRMLMKITTRIFQKNKLTLRHNTCRNL